MDYSINSLWERNNAGVSLRSIYNSCYFYTPGCSQPIEIAFMDLQKLYKHLEGGVIGGGGGGGEEEE